VSAALRAPQQQKLGVAIQPRAALVVFALPRSLPLPPLLHS
jgi:hypothetical protein